MNQRISCQKVCRIFAAALVILFAGSLSKGVLAAPLGKHLFQKPGAAPQATPQPEGKQTHAMVAANDQYTIGPEDVLQISVWHEPDVSGPVSVRPDGDISMPLIGDLKASGLTPVMLQGTLTEKLKAYIANPEVSVTVQQVKSKNFNVLGEVQRPGSFPLAHPITVLDAIGVAGGFRDFAKETKIYVLRRTADGGTIRLPFNYKEVVKGVRSEQNVELRPDDSVIVP